MIRLIVTDMDGTLLRDHDDIHPDNLVAIRKAMEKDIKFAVASGRSAASCSILLHDAGLDDAYIIGVNGCQVLDKPFGKTLALYHLDNLSARAAIDIFQAHGLESCLYTEDAIVYSNANALDMQETIHNAEADFAAQMARAGVQILAGPDAMEKALMSTPMKAFCMFGPGQEEAFAKARRECARLPGVEITSSGADNFEVMPTGVDKGMGLQMLAGRLGIAREEIVAFGDNENDLPMLRWAGHAFAMENATEDVKREITRITGHCRKGGVARGLEELGIV